MKSINRSSGARLALMLLLVAAGCSDEGRVSSVEVGPEPGVLSVAIVSPHGGDGAVSFVVRGDGITSPETVNDDHKLFAVEGAPGGDELRVAVLGRELSGTLLRFSVPDVNRIDAYSVELIEVADEANQPRESLDGYSLRIVSTGDVAW